MNLVSQFGFLALALGTIVVGFTVWRHQRGNQVSEFVQRLYATLYFLVLAAVVLGPLLIPRGYILALDVAWGPHYVFNQLDNPASLSRVVISGFMFILQTVFGGALAQSIFIFVILFLIGWGMYTVLPIERRVAKYFAGTFYLLNPFVYDRLISGQWLLLLGYAMLPFAVRAVYRLMKKPDQHQALILAGWWLAMTLCAFHYLFIFGLIFIVGWGIALLGSEDRQAVVRAWAAALGWYLLFNLFWLIPAFVSAGDSAFVDRSHAYTFATHGDILNSPWVSVLWLQGFFGQKGIEPAIRYPGIAALFLPLIGLAVYGTIKALRQRTWRDLAATLTLSAYLAIVLAVGVSAIGSRTVYLWLFTYVPGFTAMREPQKFAALLAFFYAVFGAYGLIWLFDRLRYLWQRIALVVIAGTLVVVQIFPMLNGLSGQLHRIDYPVGWYRVRDMIDESHQGNILVLPWQEYFKLPFAYTDKVITNPAPSVFDRTTFVSRRIDVAGATEPPNRPIDLVADKIDWKKPMGEGDLRVLRAYNIRWIVVLNSPKMVNAQQLLTLPAIREAYRDSQIALFELDPE